ncbi:MAG: aspartate carbamoyltransferase catalytic subunit [Phycisphaerae bacterium]
MAKKASSSAPPAESGPPAQPFLWHRKDLLGMDELSAAEITHLLDTAESFKEVSTRSIKKVPALRGKVVALLFFEDSTRTRMSFELAASRLSADTLLLTSRGSSVTKGETTLDTARNIEAMGVDIFVVRHGQSGSPHMLARKLKGSVVNAGDGQHEHPTQALLDIFTIRQRLGRLDGLKVAIVGDIAHSRVARSNILGLRKLGAEVIVVGPPTLVPGAVEAMGCTICHRLDDVLGEVDVINMLRIQFERFSGSLFPSVREYSRLYGMNSQRLARCRKDVLIMHPGPINRGVEITSDVADGPNSCILQQVTNGLAIRMAVLYLVSQGNQ